MSHSRDSHEHELMSHQKICITETSSGFLLHISEAEDCRRVQKRRWSLVHVQWTLVQNPGIAKELTTNPELNISEARVPLKFRSCNSPPSPLPPPSGTSGALIVNDPLLQMRENVCDYEVLLVNRSSVKAIASGAQPSTSPRQRLLDLLLQRLLDLLLHIRKEIPKEIASEIVKFTPFSEKWTLHGKEMSFKDGDTRCAVFPSLHNRCDPGMRFSGRFIYYDRATGEHVLPRGFRKRFPRLATTHGIFQTGCTYEIDIHFKTSNKAWLCVLFHPEGCVFEDSSTDSTTKCVVWQADDHCPFVFEFEAPKARIITFLLDLQSKSVKHQSAADGVEIRQQLTLSNPFSVSVAAENCEVSLVATRTA